MYTEIINPKTFKKVKINSKLGKKIILSYINQLISGGYYNKYNDDEEWEEP